MLRIIYATSVSGSQVKLSLDEKDISGVVELPKVNGTKWGSIIIKGLQMIQGYHVLKVEAINGDFDLYSLKFEMANNESVSQVNNFDSGLDSNWKYTDGEWLLSDNALMSGGTGKRIMGDYEWCDYSVEVDIKYINGSDAGVIFRSKNPSMGNSGNSPQAGIDFFQGYYVNINNTQVNLSKHNYNKTLLASSSESTFKPGVWYHLKIKVIGNKISVFVDNMDNPILEYEDKFPFMGGGVGLRTSETKALFDNLKVKYEKILKR